MLAVVPSSSYLGIQAYPVRVEVDYAHGMPSFSIVGLPDVAVRESRDRVAAAIKNTGFHFPSHRITVNLSPADIRKEGAAFDLPIALGILAASEQVSLERLGGGVLVGELSLDGTVRGIRGTLPIAMGAQAAGTGRLYLPEANREEASVVAGLTVVPVPSLGALAMFLRGERELPPYRPDPASRPARPLPAGLDLADVKGQAYARRALEVAAAGGHNLLMIGPPGSGKSMLARRLPGILPAMSVQEAVETTRIHSVAGLVQQHAGLVPFRPFRSPHHTVSDIALLGGGSFPRPGEVSLAHHGVLFLDELPEYHRNVLEVLREPMEEGEVTVSRAKANLTYPARFMLVAAMNPCPCGYLGDPHRECECGPYEVRKYRGRISGPLLDRIDLHVEVPALQYSEMRAEGDAEPSTAVRARVEAARAIQHARNGPATPNARLTVKQIRRFCGLDASGERLMRTAIEHLALSARGVDRTLKVARTIADLAGMEKIASAHVAEAIQYRDGAGPVDSQRRNVV